MADLNPHRLTPFIYHRKNSPTMNTRLIPLLVLLCLIPIPALALDAHTDKTDYLRGEQVTVTGNIVPTNGTELISIWILQKNTWYDRANLEVNGSEFTHTFTITKDWLNDGTYVARVDYNGEEFKIPFTISTPAVVTPPVQAPIEEEPVTTPPPTEQQPIEEPIITETVPAPTNQTTTETITNQTIPQIDQMVTKPIPSWIKGVFVYWANGQISDNELIEAIKFLVNTGVLVL